MQSMLALNLLCRQKMMLNSHASTSIQMLMLQVLPTHLLDIFRSRTLVIAYHELISMNILPQETVAGSNETFMNFYVTNEEKSISHV